MAAPSAIVACSASAPAGGYALRDALARPVARAWALSLAINLALLSPSLFMLQVYDRVLVTRSLETLAMLAGLTVATLVLFAALDQARARLLALAGMDLERRLGPVLLSRVIVASARRTGEPVHEALRDLGQLRALLAGPGLNAVLDAPWSIVYLLLVAAFDVRLGLLATASVALLLGLTAINHRLAREGLARVQDGARGAQRLADRALQNAEVVTALGMFDALAARWLARTGDAQERTLRVSTRTSGLGSLSRALRQGVQVAMMSLGAWLVIGDGATPGVMIATTIILGRALAPVEQVIGGWQALAEARASFRRLHRLLSADAQAPASTALPRPSGALSLESVAYAAPGEPRALLRGVSLQLQPGELLALVGPSGAGKTTLARLMAGVLAPAAGHVRLDGADLRQHDPRTLGAALGYLPQDVELFDGTVAENIARFTDASAEAIVEAARAAGAHELILRLPQGYDTPVGDAGQRLSGGQRQRVALARALFGAPSLVILDEPDASLDGEGEDALVAALQRLRTQGTAVVAVTQRRRLLGLADRVVVLRDGVVERCVSTRAEDATPAPAKEA